MSARIYELAVVGNPARSDRREQPDLHAAAGVLSGIALSLVFWLALALLLI